MLVMVVMVVAWLCCWGCVLVSALAPHRCFIHRVCVCAERYRDVRRRLEQLLRSRRVVKRQALELVRVAVVVVLTVVPFSPFPLCGECQELGNV